MIRWQRFGGYEVSSKGDSRFSAFNAKMPDGRTIEHWYQCDIKGYDIGGTNWRMGKGKPPIQNFNRDQLYELYLSCWRLWAIRNYRLMGQLLTAIKAHGNIVSDRFVTSEINQARALAQILNEWS